MKNEPKPKRKVFRYIILALLAVLAIFIGVIAANASRNWKVMEDTVTEGLRIVEEYYPVKALDAGDYSDLTAYGVLHFHTDQYEVEGLGNLSVLTTNMAFMQMVSFLLTPYDKAVPLMTLDFMYILGNRKSYVEFYDLAADTGTEEYGQVLDALRELRSRYDDLTELEVEEKWYDAYTTVVMHKELPSKEDARNKDLFFDSLHTYLEASAPLAPLEVEDAKLQWENTRDYSEGLITQGGVSTDVFKKALGEEKTRDFFNKVFFGSENYAP